jgi:hypothetical protein
VAGYGGGCDWGWCVVRVDVCMRWKKEKKTEGKKRGETSFVYMARFFPVQRLLSLLLLYTSVARMTLKFKFRCCRTPSSIFLFSCFLEVLCAVYTAERNMIQHFL